ncbi:DUF6531 domain-containing protein [Chitiniphilus purpureus]|uniref:DUF6531 domain-containing protein n=1 Tax=Chitiniphilus purpureus TaxID=2981137 RepID=A0ABY6DRT7_9NEIS|nr:DUF6531 domain-containing protein [Chitiniphilus sp. CD1]UXY16938.1 DUF6531 domain-containing protein [Chitiniphilus sp. CD1]
MRNLHLTMMVVLLGASIFPVSAASGKIGFVASDGTKFVLDDEIEGGKDSVESAVVDRLRRKKGTFSVVDSFKYTASWSGCSASGRAYSGGVQGCLFNWVEGVTAAEVCRRIAIAEKARPPIAAPNMRIRRWRMESRTEMFPTDDYICVTEFDSNAGPVRWEHVVKMSTPTAPSAPDVYSDVNKGECDADPQESISAMCGNPIHVGTGNKFQAELDYAHSKSPFIKYVRYYNSLGTSIALPLYVAPNWSDNFHAFLIPDAGESDAGLQAYRPDGRLVVFRPIGGGRFAAATNPFERLENLGPGEISPKWRYTNAQNIIEDYDAQGQLISISGLNGERVELSYNEFGQILNIQDKKRPGLGLRFEYGFTAGMNLLRRVWLISPGQSDEAIATYEYDPNTNNYPGGRLFAVTYADGKQRQYRYEDPDFKDALTSLVDEDGNVLATWKYNDDGLAYESSHAGNVGKITVAYGVDDLHATVTSASGAELDFELADVAGNVKVKRRTRSCAGVDCTGEIQLERDSRGNVVKAVDALSSVTTYVYDPVRHLETSRTEAAGTPEARSISTMWHPNWRLPDTIDEPGRVTKYVYDGQGNLKSKAVTANGEVRQQSWTYLPNGFMETATDERGKVTRYTYDELGNVKTITNPAGQVTQFPSYDAHGNVLEMVDADGRRTLFAYDQRQRLITRTESGEKTQFEYYSTGLLKRIVFPDQSHIGYRYNFAHQLIGVEHSSGSRIDYVPDSNGNIEQEDRYDADGVLAAGLQVAQQARMLPAHPRAQ